MLTTSSIRKPECSDRIMVDAESKGFNLSCDIDTAMLLRSLAGSVKNGKLLELGTGAGYSTSWILDGMDSESLLISVELNEEVQEIAKRHLGLDHRIQFFTMNGEDFIKELRGQMFDFIFADTWPGKFYVLEETLDLLKSGGLYIIDDLLPIPSWPEEHLRKVENCIGYLDSREDLLITKLNWSTGLIIATKK
jgi:predicted O-methyltransferase YrrM